MTAAARPALPDPRALWAAAGERVTAGVVAIGGPLVVGVATGELATAATASLGGFTAVYGHGLPFRRRAGVVAGAGLAIVLASAATAAAAGSPLLLALVLGAVAGGAVLVTDRLRTGPPGALVVVLVAGTAAAGSTAEDHLLVHTGWLAVGVALGWAAAMARWLVRPAAPEQRAAAAAHAAVAALAAAPGPATRAAAARALTAALTAARSASRRTPAPDRAAAEAGLAQAEERFLDLAAAGERSSPAQPGAAPRARTAVPSRWWHAGAFPAAARTALAAGAAGAACAALQLPSVAWAAVSATAVLSGQDRPTTHRRARQRVLGTVGGAALAAALLLPEPSAIVVVAVVLVLQAGVELLVATHYAAAVVLITPLALSLTHLAAPGQPVAELVAVRVAETVVGALLAVAAWRAVLPRAASRRLAGALPGVLDDVRGAALPGGSAAHLPAVLGALHATSAATAAELGGARTDDQRTDDQRSDDERLALVAEADAVEDLGWAVVSARASGDEHLLAALRSRLAT